MGTTQSYGRIGEEEVNAADDTIYGATPASPRLGQQKQRRSPLKHGLEQQPEARANLEDRDGSSKQKARNRPTEKEKHNPEDLLESKRLRLSNEAWEKNDRANEAVCASQRHLRALTEKTQVATTNL